MRIRQAGRTVDLKARNGVIITTGAFGCNPDMLREYAPLMLDNSYPIGIPYNDGAGIQLGLSVGAATQAMNNVMATASYQDWLQPLTTAPYAAFDVSFNKLTYFFFTLGGLKVTARAEVLDTHDTAIPGLFAAGACASTIPQDGKGYASGLSLGPASFFGRVAGRVVAGRQ